MFCHVSLLKLRGPTLAGVIKSISQTFGGEGNRKFYLLHFTAEWMKTVAGSKRCTISLPPLKNMGVNFHPTRQCPRFCTWNGLFAPPPPFLSTLVSLSGTNGVFGQIGAHTSTHGNSAQCWTKYSNCNALNIIFQSGKGGSKSGVDFTSGGIPPRSRWMVLFARGSGRRELNKVSLLLLSTHPSRSDFQGSIRVCKQEQGILNQPQNWQLRAITVMRCQ